MSEPQYIVPRRAYDYMQQVADQMEPKLGRQPTLPELLAEMKRREASDPAADRVETKEAG